MRRTVCTVIVMATVLVIDRRPLEGGGSTGLFERYIEKVTKGEIKKGDYNTMLAELNAIIRADPSSWKSYNERGVVYEAQGKLKDALEEFATVIRLAPKQEITGYVNLARIYLKTKQLALAFDDANKALVLAPKSAPAHLQLGVCHEGFGEAEKALASYNTAIEVDPLYVNSYINRGVLYTEHLGKPTEALADYTRAIELDGKSSLAYSNRGKLYSSLGQSQKAMQDLNTAIQLNPEFHLAYINRAVEYASRNQLDRAVKDLDRAEEINPMEAETYINRGWVLHKLGKLPEALQDLNKAVALAPNDPLAYANRHHVHIALGNLGLAREDEVKYRLLKKR